MEWLMAAPDRVVEELVKVRVQFFNMPDLQKAQQAVGAGNAAAAAQPKRFEEEDLQNLKVPALVYWTEFNPNGGPDLGEYFASLIPGAQFYSMPDAGHWPQYEHPAVHDQVIADFIKGK
jgi:pimeloyl-ACP methyl ester carboxylesterase